MSSSTAFTDEAISRRAPSSGFKGFGVLTWFTFWKFITNPITISFSLVLPILMYLIFGSGQSYAQNWGVHGNAAASVLANMTTYGVVLVASSMGANAALDRTMGISRLFALTPMRSAANILARLIAAVGAGAIVVAIVYAVGAFTGAQMEASAWALTPVIMLPASILAAAIGLAVAFTVRSDGAYAASSAVILLSAVCAGMFMPLSMMGPVFSVIAPFTPLYGITNMVQVPLQGPDSFHWADPVNFVVWTVLFVGIAVWGQRRDTNR